MVGLRGRETGGERPACPPILSASRRENRPLSLSSKIRRIHPRKNAKTGETWEETAAITTTAGPWKNYSPAKLKRKQPANDEYSNKAAETGGASPGNKRGMKTRTIQK